MKTMHLTNSWHESSGGIATFYRALVAEANRRRQPIRLVVPGAHDRTEEIGEFGRIYFVQAPRAPLNRDYRMIYPPQFLLPGGKVQEILISEQPDLVEISDKYTLNYLTALLRLRLLPNVKFRPVTVGLSQERMDDNVRAYLSGVPFAQKLSSLYMRWLYFPFFDHHVANSEYTVAELRAAAEGHLLPRGTWIRHMGVDLDRLSPGRRKPELRRRLLQNFGSAEDGVLALYAGRLAPEKNLALLFDTLGKLSSNHADYRLLVAGDGIERQRWEEYCAKEMPGRVLFLGHIRDKQVLADLYANADVFIHPNAREPFGIAPLEAMASGLPLVAPNRGGICSYANPDNAWLAEPDADAFVRAVSEAVGHRLPESERLSRALETAQRFRWESVASSFLDLYSDLAAAERDANSAPAFVSTPAAGLQAAAMRGVSQLAAGGFRLWLIFASQRRGSRRPPVAASPLRSN